MHCQALKVTLSSTKYKLSFNLSAIKQLKFVSSIEIIRIHKFLQTKNALFLNTVIEIRHLSDQPVTPRIFLYFI
jgi:hypothetical protein